MRAPEPSENQGSTPGRTHVPQHHRACAGSSRLSTETEVEAAGPPVRAEGVGPDQADGSGRRGLRAGRGGGRRRISLVLIGIVLGLYVLSRADARLRRAAVYATGAVAGVLPVAVYNQWAFGSVAHLSYGNAVLYPGRSGHDVLGANSQGVFGVTAPSPRVALDLLFASRGLLTMSPLLIMAAVGLVLLFRRGKRAETLVVAAIAVGLLVFYSGYYLPFGGWVPGPGRFLIATIPFLGVPLACSFRRYPALTNGLAIASTAMFAAATITLPLIPTGDTSVWAHRIRDGQFSQTILRFAGLHQGWASVIPFLAGVICALTAAVASAGLASISRRGFAIAAGTLGVWVLAASVIAREQGNASPSSAVLIACAGLLGLLALAALALISTRRSRASGLGTGRVPVTVAYTTRSKPSCRPFWFPARGNCSEGGADVHSWGRSQVRSVWADESDGHQSLREHRARRLEAVEERMPRIDVVPRQFDRGAEGDEEHERGGANR